MRLGEHAGVGAGKLRREIGALWRPKLVLQLCAHIMIIEKFSKLRVTK